MKCSINKKYYFLLLILLFAGGLPAKSSNLDKTKPEDIIRLASYNIRTKGDKGDKAWEVRLNALVDVVRRNKFDMFAIQEARQGNGHKEPKADVLIFLHLLALEVGLLLQLVYQAVEPGKIFPHQLKDPADVDDNEWGGDQISKDGGGKGQMIGQAQGHAEGQSAPQLDDGDHRDQHGEDALSKFRLSQPLQGIHIGLLYSSVSVRGILQSSITVPPR